MISRRISTGLKGQAALNILDGLMGQLSDGIWENSSKMEPYWRNNHFEMEESTGRILFILEDNPGWWNPFISWDSGKILEWLGKHVKTVAKATGLKWSRDNTEPQKWYFHGDWTIQQVYFVYEMLMGRDGFMKKYPAQLVADMAKFPPADIVKQLEPEEPQIQEEVEKTDAANDSAEVAYLKSLVKEKEDGLANDSFSEELKTLLRKQITELKKTIKHITEK